MPRSPRLLIKESEVKLEEEKVVIVVSKGMITEVYNSNAGGKVIVVDLDNSESDQVTTWQWPDTQYDEERVEELLNKGSE